MAITSEKTHKMTSANTALNLDDIFKKCSWKIKPDYKANEKVERKQKGNKAEERM